MNTHILAHFNTGTQPHNKILKSSISASTHIPPPPYPLPPSSKETKTKRKFAGLAVMLLWIPAGLIRQKNLNGAANVRRSKNTCNILLTLFTYAVQRT